MTISIFDDLAIREQLLPLTYTRPVGDIRVGIDTIAQKWARVFGARISWQPAAEYLKNIFPEQPGVPDVYIAGNVLPTNDLIDAIETLGDGQKLVRDGFTIAYKGDGADEVSFRGDYLAVTHLYDIFTLNHRALCDDFAALTKGRRSQPLSSTNTVIGNPDMIFLEEGATVEGAIINVKNGPVYVAADAEIMEGSLLRGPIALCEHAVIKMGAKIYEDTTIGPWCKVGGEVANVIFHSFSNKAHDGFLGNSVIGQWCNLGANAVSSNLKNDYVPVKLWNYPAARFLPTGLQFCGLIMGDHSKAGINTMFNTGTVLGVGVNIHGTGFPRNFVASFSEGSTAGFTDVSMTKFFQIAERVMARRHLQLTQAHKDMFMAIRHCAEQYK